MIAPFPPEKFLIALSRTKSGSPLGGALLRPLAWWWCSANFCADWLITLAENFGLPFRWATYGVSAPQETVDEICSMLQNIGSQPWAAFPAGTTLDFKSEGLKTGSDTPQGDILDRADKQCDLLILGQTLTTEAGRMGRNGGSLALGRVHEGVKAEIVRAAADFVAEIIQTQLMPAVLRLNFGDDEFCPTFRLADDRDEDLTAGAEIIRTLSSAGAGSIIGLDWLGKKFGIPKPAAGEKTLAWQSQVPSAKSQMGPPCEPVTEEGDNVQLSTFNAQRSTGIGEAASPGNAGIPAGESGNAEEDADMKSRLAAIQSLPDAEFETGLKGLCSHEN